MALADMFGVGAAMLGAGAYDAALGAQQLRNDYYAGSLANTLTAQKTFIDLLKEAKEIKTGNVKSYKTFREELQEETDEWLK